VLAVLVSDLLVSDLLSDLLVLGVGGRRGRLMGRVARVGRVAG
jgi:hypothetical protein